MFPRIQCGSGALVLMIATAFFSAFTSSSVRGQDTVCDPRDFGAVADGQTNDRQAIQDAIDSCAAAGGGTVYLYSGTFLSSPIFLKTNIKLQLDSDATLLGTQNPDDYQRVPGMPDIGRSILSLVNTGAGETDVAIIGSGTIDGAGAWWWQYHLADRPRLITFYRNQRILVDGITLTNSPSFHLVPSRSQDIVIRNLSILAPADSPNTDGIDPSDSRNVNISNCLIDVGDDNIAIKAGHVDPDHPGESSADITVSDCTFLHGHGMSIGSETLGGVRRMTVQRCSFRNTVAGIRIKSNRTVGGEVAFINYKDILMENVKNPIFLSAYYPDNTIPPAFTDPGQDITGTTPNYHDISIENVTATGTTNPAGKIIAVPEMPMHDIVLTAVSISSVPTGMWLRNVAIAMSNVRIEPRSGPAFVIQENVQITEPPINPFPMSPR
jgi:polygalacturonase